MSLTSAFARVGRPAGWSVLAALSLFLAGCGGGGGGGSSGPTDVFGWPVVSSQGTGSASATPPPRIAEDFDGDGDLDFIAAVEGGVAVLVNWQDGRFTPDVTTDLPGAPASHQTSIRAVIDLPGDDRPDIVVASSTGYFVLANLDGRAFSLVATLPIPISTFPQFTSGDFDGDGRRELVALTLEIGGFAISLVTFDALLTPSVVPVAGLAAPAFSLHALDVDADGRTDVVAKWTIASSIWTTTFQVFRNDPAAGLVFQSAFLVPGSADFIEFDGDAGLEILARDAAGLNLYEAPGLVLGPAQPLIAAAAPIGASLGISWADVDGNGLLDLIEESGGTVHFQRTPMVFEAHALPPVGGTAWLTQAVLDPRPDLVFATEVQIQVVPQIGPGLFPDRPSLVFPGRSVRQILVTPFVQGGPPRLLAVVQESQIASEIVALDLSGDVLSVSRTSPLATNGNGAMILGDFDGDGTVDILTAMALSWRLLSGDGAGGFSAPVPVSIPITAVLIAAHDLDADGDPDVVSGLNGVIFVNDGTGGFSQMPGPNFVIAMGDSVGASYDIRDFDGDGRVDIGYRRVRGVSPGYVAYGTAPGPFTFAPIVALGDTTGQLTGFGYLDHDVDGDGDLDYVQIRDAGWYENDGTGRVLGSVQPLAPAFAGISRRKADLDGDGNDDEIIVSKIHDFEIWRLENGIATQLSVPLAAPRFPWIANIDLDGDGLHDAVAWTGGRIFFLRNSGALVERSLRTR